MRIFISKGEVKREFHQHLISRFLNEKDVTLFNKNLLHEVKSINLLYNTKNIEKRLEKPDFALALLSNEYLADSWLQAELNCLCVIEQSRGTKFLIPVLFDGIDECIVPAYFNANKNELIDVRNMSEKDAAVKVAEYILTMRIEHKSVFIGHGRSSAWKDLRDMLKEQFQLSYNEFNSESQAGKSNKEVLISMLGSSNFAFLIMTPEDERSDKSMHARENVIHEVGLFQGKLGFERAIILLEEGCQEFTNISGVTQIRFSQGNINAVFLQISDVLKREEII